MPERPLLLLPAPTEVGRLPKHGGAGGIHRPDRGRQQERLAPQFSRLQEAFDRRKAELRTNMTGVAPEEVLVLEIAGRVDNFLRAVQGIGLEWLAEIDSDSIEPDEDFYVEKSGDRTEKPVPRRVFLVFSDDAARQALLAFWDRIRAGEPPARGLAPLRDVLDNLVTIRPWSVRDRLWDTGVLEDWRERVEAGAENVITEIETWHRDSPARRAKALDRVQRLVLDAGGDILQLASIDEIAYTALLARLPIGEVQKILNTQDGLLVQCEAIQFFRPTGQAVAPPAPEMVTNEQGVPGPPTAPLGPPVVALLDGVPLQNHNALEDRLIVDDPDDFAATAEVSRRFHGTAMASLILHGDLNRHEPSLTRQLYVRPVLRPRGFDEAYDEAVPADVLWVDLLHRSVRRLRVGEGETPPVAPAVCIVNLSVADMSRPFAHTLSAAARVLDWLAHEYGMLFLVSAGNHRQPLNLGLTSEEFEGADAGSRQRLTLSALRADASSRRILSPAEATNVLTVGARHDDASTVPLHNDRELCSCRGLPSPLSALGLGFAKAPKPELLVSGGRAVYAARLGSPIAVKAPVEFRPRPSGPGLRAATPSPTQGDTACSAHTCGTSNATALATRAAAQLYDVLEALRAEPNGDIIDSIPRGLWLKTLLVHSASWDPEAFDAIDESLSLEIPETGRRHAEAVRFLGYGTPDPGRVAECTLQRVTVLSAGRLAAESAHVHRVPIPEALRNVTGHRRLTVTLSWFTPINPRHQKWGRADLWFAEPFGRGGLGVESTRVDVDGTASKRGTVQHEVFEGGRVATGAGQGFVEVQVNCAASAGDLTETVPYALAITLEVAPELGIEIYEQIRNRIQPQIQINP
jgi:hypothetical protein